MSRSDRWSDRDSGTSDEATEFSAAQPDSAPESMAIPMAIPARQLGSPERPGRRVSRGQRQLLERGLTERERAILDDIDRFRFLTSKQVEALHFSHLTTQAAATRICNRILKRLYGYRVIEHLERRVGGIRAGSASYVWMIGAVGERLLRADAEVRVRRREPSLHFMRHCLAIADCVIALKRGAAAESYGLQSIDTEPSCWRRYLARSGGMELLKPDLSAVTVQGEFEDHWFIEIDRGTESIPTLIRKCRQYLTYRQTGQEQDSLGVFPIVLWVLPDERRLERLREALASARGLDAAIFRLAIPDTVADLVTGGAA